MLLQAIIMRTGFILIAGRGPLLMPVQNSFENLPSH